MDDTNDTYLKLLDIHGNPCFISKYAIDMIKMTNLNFFVHLRTGEILQFESSERNNYQYYKLSAWLGLENKDAS